jgi:hypothetical protein
MSKLEAPTFIVYCLENTANGMRYIGQSCQSLNDRWSHRAEARRGGSMSLLRAIREFGAETFVGHTVMRGLTRDEANAWERELIAAYPIERLYNETAGGPDGKRSDAARARMKASCRPPQTPETVAKRAASLRKRYEDPAHREKMSAVNKANWAKRRATGSDTCQAAASARRTPEQRALTAETSRARWADPEQRERILEARKCSIPL